MANKTIYYAPISDENLILERQSDTISKSYRFSKCPVVNHKLNRTFVCKSPIDFSVKIDIENRLIVSDNSELICYKDSDLLETPSPLIQMKFCTFLLWTNDDNIWFEFTDHPMTSYNNNFVSISGWFNLSNWPRSTSLAAVFVDPQKPISIKKGDPLFRVSFYSENLNDGIILKEEKNHKKIEEMSNTMNENLSSFDRRFLLRKLFGNTKNSGKKRCPFRFLYDFQSR